MEVEAVAPVEMGQPDMQEMPARQHPVKLAEQLGQLMLLAALPAAKTRALQQKVEKAATVDHPASVDPAVARMETAVPEDAAVSAVSAETAATAEQARVDTLSASSAFGPNAR